MPSLAQQICLNHPLREAAARCPQCGHFFCRECITEHDDRVICASCLRKISQVSQKRHHPLRFLGQAGLGFLGFLTVLVFFYWMGQMLVSIPPEYHDTLWKSVWDPDQ